jgi:hypothetical protein
MKVSCGEVIRLIAYTLSSLWSAVRNKIYFGIGFVLAYFAI